jgi:TonB family protein
VCRINPIVIVRYTKALSPGSFMTNTAPRTSFELATETVDGCAVADEVTEQAVERNAEDAPDQTDVPALLPHEASLAGTRSRRGGFWLAAAVSLALHGVVVAAGAWAIGNGLLPRDIPTLGLRGDLAEGGLSEDPGVSAAGGSAPVLPAVPSGPQVSAEAPTAPEIEEPDAAAEPAAAEVFALAPPPGLPPPDAAPLIGAGEAPMTAPARPVKDPIRSTAASTAAANPGRDVGAAGAATDAAAVAVRAAAPGESFASEGPGVAAFTPPQVTGRGSGLRGRRGARGLDRRGLPIPDYPRECRRRGEEGTVVLDAAVRRDGRVDGVRVVESSGHPLLDQAAAAALREAEFTPALLGGRPAAGTVRVPYRFRLD